MQMLFSFRFLLFDFGKVLGALRNYDDDDKIIVKKQLV